MQSAEPTFPLPPKSSDRFFTPALGLGLFIVTLLAYLPALNGGLLWDDPAHLTAPSLRDLHGLWQIWGRLGATQQYYPVLHTAFWLEHRLWGDSLFPYHLLNVGLHATAACMFALVLIRIGPEKDGPSSRTMATAWLAAAVFALHPVGVESVAWISEQKNTLSLVFYLLAALAYLHFDRNRRWGWYALALALFILALLSKSVTASLPAALLLVLSLRRRLSWRRDVVGLIPWFVIGAGAGLFTAWVEQNYIGAKGTAYHLSFVERCFLAGNVVWFYLGKLVWPTNLIFIYPRWEVCTNWQWSLGCLGLAVILGAFWHFRKWKRAPLIALLFYIGSLFPALGFFNVYPFVFSYVADHWQYLPCLGMIALATESTALFTQGLLERARGAYRVAVAFSLAAVVVGALAALAVLTWRQCGLYKDSETLYAGTLARNPACWMAHNNLGLTLTEKGLQAEAITHFKQALLLKPDCADAHNNLGNALAKMPARAQEAISEFETALRYEPSMLQARINLGWALANTPGRLTEGIDHLKIALQNHPHDPDFAEAYFDFGYALAKLPDRLPEAISQYAMALQLKPEFVKARNELAIALARAGRASEAEVEFKRVLKIQPDNDEAQNNLGNVLFSMGRAPEGMDHYRRALRANPDSLEAHFNLGRALRAMGQDEEAIVEYRRALRLAPRSTEIWNSLGSALYRLERFSEASTAYKEAVLLQPDSALFHNNFGIALHAAGMLVEAIGQLRLAVQLDPHFADAHFNLAVALQQAGEGGEADIHFAASGRAKP